MKKFIFICLILLLVCIGFVNADIPITVSETGDSFIKWTWDSNVYIIDNLSVDGYTVQYFDKYSGTFILSDCKPLETHILRISNDTNSGISISNTTEEHATSVSNTLDLFWSFIFLILGGICVIVGLKVPYAAFGGFVFGCMGVITDLNNIVIDKINLSNFTMGSLYLILIVASITVAYKGNE